MDSRVFLLSESPGEQHLTMTLKIVSFNLHKNQPKSTIMKNVYRNTAIFIFLIFVYFFFLFYFLYQNNLVVGVVRVGFGGIAGREGGG